MPSKNIPVNGWPQIKELDIAAPILAELDKIETWQKSVKQETKSGAYVEFINALALDASSVIAEITASQDLHGYDKPWVGGSGKNKLHTTATSATVQGVVYTVNSDGTISTADTATNLSTLKVGTFTGLTSVTLNGCPSGGGSSSYGLQLFDETASTWGSSDYGDGVTVTTLDSTHTYSVLVVVRNGVDASGLTFKPMIRTSGDSTWEPWDNICPITGYSSVVITDVDSESQTATVTVALGSTVYGGTLDLTSGELTVTHASVDLGTLTYGKTGNDSKAFSTNSIKDEIKPCAWSSEITTAICSQYSADTGSNVYILKTDGIFGVDANGQVYFYDSRFEAETSANIKTALSGVQFVYELKTPTTTTLTAAQLEMVKGYNHISANSGNIAVTAYTGNTWN